MKEINPEARMSGGIMDRNLATLKQPSRANGNAGRGRSERRDPRDIEADGIEERITDVGPDPETIISGFEEALRIAANADQRAEGANRYRRSSQAKRLSGRTSKLPQRQVCPK